MVLQPFRADRQLRPIPVALNSAGGALRWPTTIQQHGNAQHQYQRPVVLVGPGCAAVQRAAMRQREQREVRLVGLENPGMSAFCTM
jgi:hypothetical protein